MWIIAFNFVKQFWKPLAILGVIAALFFFREYYDSRLIQEGRAEVQVVFDKYKSDQAAASKLAQDQLNEKAARLKKAEAEAQAKAEQIKQMTAKELDYEVKTKIVYRNCKLPTSGVQLYKSATKRH